MKKVFVKTLLLSSLFLSLAACGRNKNPTTVTPTGTPTPSQPTKPVTPSPTTQTGLVLSEKTKTIKVGASFTLSVTSKVDASSIMWSVDSSNVSLSVTSGLSVKVTGVKKGSASVTAINLDTGDSAACKVTVSDDAPAPTPSSTPTPSGLPVGTKVTIYLVLSKIGLYEGKAGQDVESLFLENTVTYTANVGDALPGADKVTSTSGAKFLNWMAYEGNGAPTRYDNVPGVDGKILYANFSHGSGTTPTQPVVPTGDTATFTVTDMPTWITDDGCVIFAWAWQEGVEGSWYSLEYTSETSAKFVAPSNIVGFLLARCAAGTTVPNWNQSEHSAGRVYNQSEDIDVTAGTTTYACSSWKEYNP